MKRVVDGKLYDTERAEKLHEYENMDDQGNFYYYEEALYRTAKGNYFIAGSGAAMSKYAESLGGGSWGGGGGIRPLTKPGAADWLDEHDGVEVLVADPDFADLLEEA